MSVICRLRRFVGRKEPAPFSVLGWAQNPRRRSSIGMYSQRLMRSAILVGTGGGHVHPLIWHIEPCPHIGQYVGHQRGHRGWRQHPTCCRRGGYAGLSVGRPVSAADTGITPKPTAYRYAHSCCTSHNLPWDHCSLFWTGEACYLILVHSIFCKRTW